MGVIKPDVKSLHLRVFRNEGELLKSFLFNFDVNYAKRIDANNTQLSAYIISPDRMMREAFAFTDELLLVISSYKTIQPRTIQAIEYVMKSAPFKGRVDPLTYFLVSQDADITNWASNYLMAHPQARTPIPLSFDILASQKDDRWFVRNQLSLQLYTRDIFDYQLPLDGDLFFFGRKSLVDDFVDAIRKGQNRGLFGLRKTGKTSLLFKIDRTCKELDISTCIYFDCKRPDIRVQSWSELISMIDQQISSKTGRKYIVTNDPVKSLVKLISSLDEKQKICLIFDEIEYISPLSKLDDHWKKDFIPFWQTLWSIQSEVRKVSFVVAGVNPFLCETDLIDGTQNPMFGIVRPAYLTGLSAEETKQMIRAIGGRMGLGFEDEAIDYTHGRYGGHPLLTRMACSNANQSIIREDAARPVSVKQNRLKHEQDEREEELHFYCKHVISELQDFYPDEYEMLELISSGNIVDFNELAADPGWIRHLKSYGILHIAASGKPSFRIPVMQKFVASQRARKLKIRELRPPIPLNRREKWLSVRKENILHDMKALLRVIAAKQMWQPYGNSFLPEADLLQKATVCSDWSSFSYFITEINKCLIETIELANGVGSFYGKLKSEYAELFDALNRIRLLRNNADHLRLHAKVEDGLRGYLSRDLYDRPLTQVAEPWFVLQQIVLDELFSSIQYEAAKIT